jgi:hypothetical protein
VACSATGRPVTAGRERAPLSLGGCGGWEGEGTGVRGTDAYLLSILTPPPELRR